LDVNPTNGVAAKLFKMAVKVAVPTSPQELAVSAVLPVLGKYLMQGKVVGKVLEKALEKGVVNPKIYRQLEKQLAEAGKDSIFNALDSAMETLGEHAEELLGFQYKSAVEKTIANVSNLITTILQFISDKGL
jgi:hypothetical protein